MQQKRIPLYSPYERLWHWLQAAGILLLILTGLSIHWPNLFRWIPFATAVQVHNVLGLVLVANAFLGFFYYITTGTIRQYLPEPRDFVSLAVLQLDYYLRGIFRGQPHPLEKTPQRRLNPLQQITYLVILNVLLPLQIVTGLLMWGGQYRPETIYWLGGLGRLAAIHTLGAWCFAAFLVVHVYLTTTGPKPTTYLVAMIVGYETVPVTGGREASEETADTNSVPSG